MGKGIARKKAISMVLSVIVEAAKSAFGSDDVEARMEARKYRAAVEKKLAIAEDSRTGNENHSMNEQAAAGALPKGGDAPARMKPKAVAPPKQEAAPKHEAAPKEATAL